MKESLLRKTISIVTIFLLLIGYYFITISRAESTPFEYFTGLYITKTKASPGEKVPVELYLGKIDETTKVRMFIGSSALDYLTVEIQDILTNQPYFIVPTNALIGYEYSIGMVEVSDSKGSITYNTTVGGQNYYNTLGKGKIQIVEPNSQPKLNSITINGNNNITKNDKLYFNLDISQGVDLLTVGLQNQNIKSKTLLVSINDIYRNPYIDFSTIEPGQTIYEGEYQITDIYLNPDSQDKYVRYSIDESNTNAIKLNNDIRFTISNNETDENQNVDNSENTTNTDDTQNANDENKIILEKIDLEVERAKLNQRVYVNIQTSRSINEAMLSFTDEQNKNNMTVYLKDLNTNTPYFIVPLTTSAGKYNLDYMILKDSEGNETHYRKGEKTTEINHFDFSNTIDIINQVDKNEDTVYLNNNDINMDIIEQIRQMDENVLIEIDANNNPIINSSVFSSIQGENKTIIIKYLDVEWIFNGLDIVNPKQINVNYIIYGVEKDEQIKTIVDSGAVLEFAKNGELPGKCLIRLKLDEKLADILINKFKRSETYVYYYDEPNDMLNKVAMQLNLTKDGYDEFYINHNSKFLILPNEAEPQYVSNDETDLKLNIQNNDSSNVMKENTEQPNKKLIIECVVIAICIVLLILLLSGKILSNKKK